MLLGTVVVLSSESAFLAASRARAEEPARVSATPSEDDHGEKDAPKDDSGPQFRFDFFDGSVRVPRPLAPERVYPRASLPTMPPAGLSGPADHRVDWLVLQSDVRATRHDVLALPIRPHAPPGVR